jgi:hypothetical protein
VIFKKAAEDYVHLVLNLNYPRGMQGKLEELLAEKLRVFFVAGMGVGFMVGVAAHLVA